MPLLTLIPLLGPRRAIVTPPAGAAHATVDGDCPSCAANPFRVAGAGMRPSADDRAYEADGRCVDCGAPVGIIRADMSTIFGVREDEAVGQRARVY